MFLSRDDPSAITRQRVPFQKEEKKVPHRLKKGDDDHGEIMRQTTNMDLVFCWLLLNEVFLLTTMSLVSGDPQSLSGM